MSNFDYDKVKDMEYNPDRGCYVGKNGEEFHVTPYSNGSGYKYDYYSKSPYGNAPHDSVHVKSDLNENWSRTDNDRSNGTQDKSYGSGCYLTTACIQAKQEEFNDSCVELMTLRWFRDKFVSKEDIKHYYDIAPIIVNNINNLENKKQIYDWIYKNVILPCVNAIKTGDYEFAYSRYKNSVVVLEKQFIKENNPKNKIFVKNKKF